VFIDDATGKLQHLRFCESESAFDYMISTRLYVEQHGKPLAFYSDKHSVFRVNQSSKKDTKFTQFGRVLSTLNIDIISPIHHRPKDVWNAQIERFKIA
jgi:protocatechuate 3,4-dioxygenase beta subunit